MSLGIRRRRASPTGVAPSNASCCGSDIINNSFNTEVSEILFSKSNRDNSALLCLIEFDFENNFVFTR